MAGSTMDASAEVFEELNSCECDHIAQSRLQTMRVQHISYILSPDALGAEGRAFRSPRLDQWFLGLWTRGTA